MDFAFTTAGLAVGVAVGLTGIGGSALLAPVLTLALGVSPSLTVGTDLLYSVPTKLLACVLHARRGNVDWKITRALLAGGVPGAIAGLALFQVLRSKISTTVFEASIKHAIGIAVIVACIGIIVTLLPRKTVVIPKPVIAPTVPLSFGPVVVIGAVVGFLVAITSIGAGSVTLPLLALALRNKPLRSLIGSEIAFAAFLVPLAAVGHIAFHNVDWSIALALVLGSLPGVWIGTQLSTTIGERWLRPIVIGLLAVSGWKLV